MRYFSLSLAMHICFIGTVLIGIKTANDKLARSAKPSLLTYVAEEKSTPISLTVKPTLIDKLGLTKKNKTITQFTKPQPLQKNINRGGDGTNKMLSLLHDAIAKIQIYPQSALELNQSGMVTISFLFHPDGKITQAYVSKSSHVYALDEAALAAVINASPVVSAGKYLTDAKMLSIDVVFEIGGE